MTGSRLLSCRSCGHTALHTVLSLGHTPLANALLTKDQLSQAEETFPLDLVLCPQCTLVQITETVSPEKLFREYFYRSSFSDTMLRHVELLADEMVRSRSLDAESLVIEVASNDGYLLRHYKHRGVPVLGIEPAVNIARVAEEEHGIPTVREFFGEELGKKLRADGYQADVIHAHNVLAHVPDLNGFVRGLRELLKVDGVAVIEVPYVKEMIDGCEFDTIYHEHVFYYSLTSASRLFERNGLRIVDVEWI
ncbi:MAG TPA: methyltransferase domain-containing protein, partial [Pyrinomonadaceae bacterium]|nr:methyltransferase domain-containing protein [Pyrinomonadaceae bacterium]